MGRAFDPFVFVIVISIKQAFNIAKFVFGGTQPICGPMKVQWELTYHCNLKCRHCQIWQIPTEEIRANTLALDEQKKIVDDLAVSGVKHLSFSGGEMFLQKTVYELIAYAKSRGLKVGGNSNAYLIDEDIAKKIADSGLDMLYVSLDGDNAATHDDIRGVQGAFDRALSGVDILRRVKPEIGLFFNTTINALNVSQLTGIAKIARDHKMDGLTIEMTNVFEKYSPNETLILPEESLPLLRSQIKELFENFGDLLPHQPEYFDEFETYLNNRKSLYQYRCVAGYTTAQIHPNGDLYACPVAFCKLGNLAEKSFNEVWFSKQAHDNRRDIREGRHPICWITCISPLNQYLSYLTPTRFYKLLKPNTLRHIWRKI